MALEYLGTVWDVGSEIVPVDAVDFELPAQNERSMYISRQALAAAPELIEAVHAQAAGEQLIALSPEPLTQLPPTAQAVQLGFGDTLHLVGWEQVKTDAALPVEVAQRVSPANWQIALYWQTPAKIEDDYTISVRPLVAGQLIMQGGEPLIQDHQPVWGAYPTSRWQFNELVRDVYALNLPHPPDAVQVVVYQATANGFENLGEQTLSLSE